MFDPQALGALATIHGLLLQLAGQLPARDLNRRFDPALPSAAWLLGRSVYLELHLLRGLVMQDDDRAARVRHLFGDDLTPSTEHDAALPPQNHLLNWAREIFDEDLTRLANPGELPAHPLLQDSWLAWHLAERHALSYEDLLAFMIARNGHRDRGDFQAASALHARRPCDDSTRIEQGHYRVGARDGVAMLCEQPPQVVELHAFRISRRPVCNAEYLAFIEDDGYQSNDCWDDDGRRWRADQGADAPWHWRRDSAGHWFGIGVNGPGDLHPDDPVAGLSAHEARAFASWAAAHGGGLSGAVPQHEYQWEIASRLGAIEGHGRSWEWCANGFHTYPGFAAPPDPALESCLADEQAIVLRGGCLHTRPSLRRSTFRRCASPDRRELFAGTRLVMPAGKAAWE